MRKLSKDMKIALKAAAALERYRIVELLIDQEVIRRDAFGVLVFHNEGFLYAKDIVGLEPADGQPLGELHISSAGPLA